jgi:hypothetical protein
MFLMYLFVGQTIPYIWKVFKCGAVEGWRRTVGPRGEFRPRQTRQLPRAVDLKGRFLFLFAVKC